MQGQAVKRAGFPVTMATVREHHGPLPAAVDVAIVGGGIVGVLTGWELAREGLRVLVCEKGRLAGEQSGRNWGWIRQTGRDLAEMPLMLDAMRRWGALPRALKIATGFRQAGITYLARNERQMGAYARWLDGARPFGVDSRLLTGREVAAILPARGGWVGGLHTPSDAQAEPFVTVPTLAHAAVADGLVIREGCAVRGLHLAAGRVAGVETEAGPVACARVIVAGGAWSGLFLGAHGITLPQLSVTSSVCVTAPLPDILPGAAADNRFAIRRRTDGGYTLTPWSRHEFFIGPAAFRHLLRFLPQFLADPASTRFRRRAPAGFPDAWDTPRRWPLTGPSPFERLRILDPAPWERELARVRAEFAQAFPDLGPPPVVRTWAGAIDVTPDSLPVIDRTRTPGLYVATGLSGHGFGIAPGVAGVVADLVQERAPRHDLAPFRLARFGLMGSRHRPTAI